MFDAKQSLTKLLTAVIPYLPWQLKLQAYALLAVLKTLDLGVAVADAPATVHEFVGGLFDRLIAALTAGGYDVLAKVAGLVKRYVLTGLTDAAWDQLSALLGFEPVFAAAEARACGERPIADVEKELEACCAA